MIANVPHFGSSLLLVNGDPKSPSYGRILIIVERGSPEKPHLAGMYAPPGGSREAGEDFITTAIRETAEEATDGSEKSIQEATTALFNPERCRLDLTASHKQIVKPGKPPRVVGKLFAVLFDGNVFPELKVDLPDNPHTSRRLWMTVDEIRRLGTRYRFHQQVDADLRTVAMMARHYGVVLA